MQEEEEVEVGIDMSGAEGETGIETTAGGEATAESGIEGSACTSILSTPFCVLLLPFVLRIAYSSLKFNHCHYQNRIISPRPAAMVPSRR
jgi:hypothetical protein